MGAARQLGNGSDIAVTSLPSRRSAGTQLSLCDDSGQTQQLQAALESEQRFRALFNAAPVGIAECMVDGTVVDTNQEMCRILGYPREEILGQSASWFTADADERDHQAADLNAVGTGQNYSATRRFRRRDGSIAHAKVSAVGLAGPDGTIDRLLATAVDITDQIITETALVAANEEHERRQAFIDAVLDSIDVGVVACDENANLTVFNRATKRWHGTGLDDKDAAASDSDNFGSSFSLFDEDMQPLPADDIPLLRALRDGSVTGAEMVISPHGLPATRVRCTGRAINDQAGRPLGAVVAMTDITQDRAQQAALRASERLFRATFDNDPAGLALVNASGRVLQANPALRTLLGDSLMSLDSVTELRCDDPDAVTNLLTLAHDRPGTAVTSEQTIRAQDRELWVVLTATEVPDPRRERTTLLQVEDITHRKETEIRLTRQALYDGLTELPNRVMLLDRLQTALDRLERHADEHTYVFFVDLDGFKAVNDTYGHRGGDHLLTTVAGRLVSATRPEDTVARLGGDEFVVIVERLVDPDEAHHVAQRLLDAAAEPVDWNGHVLTVTASIGIAPARAGADPEQLLHSADAAMYEAKRLGKERFEGLGDTLVSRRRPV